MNSAHDQYLVSHGKSGVIGVFTAPEALVLRRGQRVLVQSPRGCEVGAVLRPASLHQARLLGAVSAGELVRALSEEDAGRQAELADLEQRIFEFSRTWVAQGGLRLEVLDVDLLFDGAQAIVQFVGQEADCDKLAAALESQFGLSIRLENLSIPHPAEPEEDEQGGCGKPDCGRESSGGSGCSTCSTGGGCSSCGNSGVELREYFGHLRTKMETTQRIPLT